MDAVRLPVVTGVWLLSALAVACADSGEVEPAAASREDRAVCSPGEGELGRTPLRRLSRFEYGRTLADLVGVSPEVALALPADEKSLGFDDIAEAHSISALHAAKYLEVAESVGDALVADAGRLAAFAGCNPVVDASCVEPFVRAFGPRAYRRALGEEELAALLSLFATLAEPSAADGVSAVVTAILQAPPFLYRLEPAGGAAFGAALASRLSYLILGSQPDEELLAAAERGALDSEAGLLAEADRLLASEPATESFTHFMSEWWNLDRLAGMDKDRGLYRTWSEAIPGLFAQETQLFLRSAWLEGPTLERFFTTPVTYADRSLATFYGIPVPSGSGFQRVALDPARAAGLLTQGAFLATHAKANQTSPVLRGKFVRERLFCTPPEPPPPDIIVRPPVVDPRLSTRERFAQHTAEPRCAGCHSLMDPIGFAFEHHDPTGRYRDTDGGKPVDATGELTGTDVDGALDGVPSLGARLVESDEVRACVAKQWFRYAFGRQESASSADTCALHDFARTLRETRGNLKAVIRETVRSALFREQRPEEPAP